MPLSANNPNRTSWLYVNKHSDFPIQNIPFGVFLTREDIITIGTRIGDTAIDLRKMAVRSMPANTTWTFDYTVGSKNEAQAIIFDSLKMSVEDYTLEPGEVFLMAPHYDAVQDDGSPIHRPELIEMADYIGYKKELTVPGDTTNLTIKLSSYNDRSCRTYQRWRFFLV